VTQLIDLAGRRFGQLEVLELSTLRSSGGERMWLCKCACGKVTVKAAFALKSGKVMTCGCGFRAAQKAWHPRNNWFTEWHRKDMRKHVTPVTSRPVFEPPTEPFRTVEQVEAYLNADMHAVTCLLCGHKYARLAFHLLQSHEMTADVYRFRFGIPDNYSLDSAEYRAHRWVNPKDRLTCSRRVY
jgi:hypothetical protein